ncbi:MAG: hypothetical protein AAF694_05010 [Bacteroidota bacterium]
MKIQRFPQLRLFLWGVLLTQLACSPKLKEGLISYQINPAYIEIWEDATLLSRYSKPYPLEQKVYFNQMDWAELPIGKHHLPLFHLHTQYDGEQGKTFDHRDYLDSYFLIERLNPIPLKFIPMNGREKVLGYMCKKGKIILNRNIRSHLNSPFSPSTQDTAIVWYTEKLPLSYSPWFGDFDHGLVLRMEQKHIIVDSVKFDSILVAEGHFRRKVDGSIEKINPGQSFTISNMPYSEITRVTEAVSIKSISPPDSLFKPQKPYKVITPKEFEYIIQDLQPYQETERP